MYMYKTVIIHDNVHRTFVNKICFNMRIVNCNQAIQEQMSSHGAEIVHFEDVKDEIFDMVKPADPARITLSDLLSW